MSKYKPITIEAQQPNGEWHTRNRMGDENDLVIGGQRDREWLIAAAIKKLQHWVYNTQNCKPMRLAGIPQRVIEYADPADRWDGWPNAPR